MSRRFLTLAAAGLALVGVWQSGNASVQVKVLPGSASRGEQLLAEKGCTNCHAFEGRGRSRAPDLSRTPPHATTPGQVASAMWNHAPEMWVNPAGQRWNAELTSSEAADLFAYLYSALYFAPAGDVARGKAVFDTNCGSCHTQTPQPNAVGRPISSWSAVRDPIAWAGHMWNHSPEMNDAMVKKGRPWPKLSSQDIADLMIYFRSLPELRGKSSTFGVGEPEQGLVVFERSCESCHSFGRGTGKTIDLLQRRAPQTVTGYVAAMWNHAPLMAARAGAQFPKLEPEQMPDLIAFLFSQSYFFERGDIGRGRRVFENKNCARCHEQRRSDTGAPDLSQSAELYSPVTLTSAVWHHTPGMFAMTKREGLSWPKFQGSEMADLIAYLNSRVIVRIAASPGKRTLSVPQVLQSR